MKKLNLVINQHPIPQKRHRHSKWGTYDPNSKDKVIVKNIIKTQSKGFYTEKPVSVIIDFNVLRPKSHYRTGKNSHLLKKTSPLFCFKYDLDNLAKFILDCGTETLWKDDSQVVNLSLSKRWVDSDPSTNMTIYKI